MSTVRPLISVCIPTYEMKGLGASFLRQSFDVLARQTFKDFEVVISDHSQDDTIRNLCDEYADRLDIKYHRNTERRGSSSANLNNAIAQARGTLIKILFQDDFLFKDTALEEIVRFFDIKSDHWLITACEQTTDGVHFYRPFYPVYRDDIHISHNTISSPSVLTIKNEQPLLFDENLIHRMDTDYYKRLFDRFGPPKILNEINVVNRAGPHQVTHTLVTESVADAEFRYILDKYHVPFASYRIAQRALTKRINRFKRWLRHHL